MMSSSHRYGGTKVEYLLIGMTILMAGFLLPPCLEAADRDVCPSCPYTTIQSAINAASGGDRVRIAQGTYYENLRAFYRKGVTISGGWSADFVTKVEDPSLTVIDGSSTDKVLEIYAPSDVTVENMTLQNGRLGAGQFGAGIQVVTTSELVHLNLQNVVV